MLDGINLIIAKGARVGFVGSTGSGKSTVLDLVMGLLEPTHGRILVDGQPVSHEYRRAWQRTVAHVPQSIFLADASVAENIAFGVPPQLIDLERARRAAEQAHIAEFIESRPHGYGEIAGERGVRLSGGQRQRIGIARALYKQASVLIFDELRVRSTMKPNKPSCKPLNPLARSSLSSSSPTDSPHSRIAHR